MDITEKVTEIAHNFTDNNEDCKNLRNEILFLFGVVKPSFCDFCERPHENKTDNFGWCLCNSCEST